jgi:hypothetical protein
MFYIVRVYTIYTRPVSVRTRYSRLCPTSSSYRYHGSLDTWTVVCLTAALVEKSESEFYVTTDSQSASLSWNKDPSGSYDQILITVWQLRFCFCEAPSLTRGRVCLLYVLLARQCSPWVWGPMVSRRYFTVSDLRLPFSSPPTTRRVTVEVFDPASTRVTLPVLVL